MKVWTHSEPAVKAQQGVMEFLLINHPLDCPICDQGGECQLQDLAVGYGASASRYNEAKRVVFHKDLGPLISAEEMTRCIQCTRCVRFGQEIAGVMELGMIGRGEHAEIVAFVGRTRRLRTVRQFDRRVPGRRADVQAIPLFRADVGAGPAQVGFAARFARQQPGRAGQGEPRDARPAAGERGGQRVLAVRQGPLFLRGPQFRGTADRADGEARRRLEGRRLADRARIRRQRPDRRRGQARRARAGRAGVASRHAGGVGAGRAPGARTQEATTSISACGKAIFAAMRVPGTAPWLGMPVAELNSLDRALVVGSFLRKDHPLVAQRLRQAAKKGTQVSMLHSVDDDWLLRVEHKSIVAPSQLPAELAGIVVAAAQAAGKSVPAALSGIEPTDARQGDRCEPSLGQEGGDLARQLRAAARGSFANPRARATACGRDGRDAGLPDRGGQYGRRASRRRHGPRRGA